ncbi:MAG: threonine--tRNA ligase [Myxococcales bacterium]|nr:MAG: threonine--tRNA ligase [Myxococcales bacterium]
MLNESAMSSANTNKNLSTIKEILEKQGKHTPQVVAALVNGNIVDLHTPVDPDSSIEALNADSPKALDVIRHSTAHVMADAVQRLFPGTQVTIGPAIGNGFYYDFDRPEGQFSEDDLERIEKAMLEIIEADHPFSREEVSRNEAAKLFKEMGEIYKLEILEGLEEPITLYRHGSWFDLCKGPHVPRTSFLKAIKLTGVAGAYWRGDERNKMLQRIYGTAFPSAKALRAHLNQLEEAKKRDHRKLGKELELFGFHPWAPASPFFLPKGALIYNRLVEYIRAAYTRHGYDEVVTPQIFDAKLFHTSGHLPAYTPNMYFAVTEESKNDDEHRFCIKPMNCPGHALMYGMSKRSYRELPLRFADFGRLHRYERSGVTQGLTRVRTFAQDDAHIFCKPDDIQDEISRFIDLVFEVYQDFGFSDLNVMIATRPIERLGSDAQWDSAEEALETAVKNKGLSYQIAEGEGVFYGPKIEFHLNDAIGRSWQLGTIQVDFNMPERFDLTFVGEDNQNHRPIVLHRALLGSIERFMGVLIEHVGGAFPTWLAPEQVRFLTVSEKFNDFAEGLLSQCRSANIRAQIDGSSDKLGAKIRNARLMRIPFLAIIGEKEVSENGVALRSRDENKDLGFVSTSEFIQKMTVENCPPSYRAS